MSQVMIGTETFWNDWRTAAKVRGARFGMLNDLETSKEHVNEDFLGFLIEVVRNKTDERDGAKALQVLLRLLTNGRVKQTKNSLEETYRPVIVLLAERSPAELTHKDPLARDTRTTLARYMRLMDAFDPNEARKNAVLIWVRAVALTKQHDLLDEVWTTISTGITGWLIDPAISVLESIVREDNAKSFTSEQKLSQYAYIGEAKCRFLASENWHATMRHARALLILHARRGDFDTLVPLVSK